MYALLLLFSGALSPAAAAPPTLGLPLDTAGLTAVHPIRPSVGWTAQLNGAQIRGFTAESPEAAQAWLDHARATLTLPTSDYAYADAAFGDGIGLLGFRQDNLAFLIVTRSQETPARAVADTLQSRFVSLPPRALPPARVVPTAEGRWEVKAPPLALDVQVLGGQAVWGAPGVYLQPPTEVIVWDRFGRPMESRPARPPSE